MNAAAMRKHPFILLLAAAIISASSPINGSAEETLSGILYTRDKVTIAYDHYKNGKTSVIVVCPGFYNSKSNRWMRKTVEILSPEYDVIIFDFRGHGRSGGKYTWSARENMDVDAVLDYAKAQGYRHIGIVAYSLGAAAAINSAADRDDVDSMVLISCPIKFDMTDFHFWEPGMFFDLKDNIDCGWEGKGARAASMFIPKTDPIDSIKRLKGTAILFIHGDNDWVIKDWHSRKLYDAAAGIKKFEIIKGGLHAERMVQFHADRLKDLILGWFSETLR